MTTKAGYPEVGDVIFHDLGREKEEIFKKLVKKYEKEFKKPHVYFIKEKYRYSIFKNVRFLYKKTVGGFYPETRHPIYDNQYIDFKQGRFKTYEAEQKAWCDLNEWLVNKSTLPPTDKEQITVMAKQIAKLEAQLVKDKNVSKKAGKTQ